MTVQWTFDSSLRLFIRIRQFGYLYTHISKLCLWVFCFRISRYHFFENAVVLSSAKYTLNICPDRRFYTINFPSSIPRNSPYLSATNSYHRHRWLLHLSERGHLRYVVNIGWIASRLWTAPIDTTSLDFSVVIWIFSVNVIFPPLVLDDVLHKWPCNTGRALVLRTDPFISRLYFA